MSNVVIEPDSRDQSLLQEMIGYLNFSSGASDASFLKNLNLLVAGIERRLGGKAGAVAGRSPFWGRAFGAVRGGGGPWEETERVVGGALESLNDYIGYRPVAALES